jgi:hypothetical protein
MVLESSTCAVDEANSAIHTHKHGNEDDDLSRSNCGHDRAAASSTADDKQSAAQLAVRHHDNTPTGFGRMGRVITAVATDTPPTAGRRVLASPDGPHRAPGRKRAAAHCCRRSRECVSWRVLAAASCPAAAAQLGWSMGGEHNGRGRWPLLAARRRAGPTKSRFAFLLALTRRGGGS